MARYNKIHLGPTQCNLPQTMEAIAAADTMPGSIVTVDGALAGTGDTSGVKLYIADTAWCSGGDTDTANASGDTMIMQNPLPDLIYAALLADGVNMTAKDFALKVGANGELVAATAGTDVVQFYGNEVYNNDTGSAQLVKVRVA